VPLLAPVYLLDRDQPLAVDTLTGLRRLKPEGPAHEVALMQFLPYNL